MVDFAVRLPGPLNRLETRIVDSLAVFIIKDRFDDNGIHMFLPQPLLLFGLKKWDDKMDGFISVVFRNFSILTKIVAWKGNNTHCCRNTCYSSNFSFSNNYLLVIRTYV